MYSLPSASHIRAPFPRTMYGGSPPTDLNARTGESTPPGITRDARICSSCDFLRGFISIMNIPQQKDEPQRTRRNTKGLVEVLQFHRVIRLVFTQSFVRTLLFNQKWHRAISVRFALCVSSCPLW